MGRSIKKGPFVQAALLKHVEAMNASGKKQVIKTWSRASTIFRSELKFFKSTFNWKLLF